MQATPAILPSSALFAEGAASRREVVGAVFTAAVVASLPGSAVAEEGSGSIVEFQVDNLDGVEGNTGTIKIQLRPEWAPLGALRFAASNKKQQYSSFTIRTCHLHKPCFRHTVLINYVGFD